MKYNVLGEQRKSQIIQKYLESISAYRVTATQTGNKISLTVGSNLFSIDTSRKEVVNSRKVLSR